MRVSPRKVFERIRREASQYEADHLDDALAKAKKFVAENSIRGEDALFSAALGFYRPPPRVR